MYCYVLILSPSGVKLETYLLLMNTSNFSSRFLLRLRELTSLAADA